MTIDLRPYLRRYREDIEAIREAINADRRPDGSLGPRSEYLMTRLDLAYVALARAARPRHR